MNQALRELVISMEREKLPCAKGVSVVNQRREQFLASQQVACAIGSPSFMELVFCGGNGPETLIKIMQVIKNIEGRLLFKLWNCGQEKSL